MDLSAVLIKTAESLRKEAERLRKTPMRKQAAYRIDKKELRSLIKNGR